MAFGFCFIFDLSKLSKFFDVPNLGSSSSSSSSSSGIAFINYNFIIKKNYTFFLWFLKSRLTCIKWISLRKIEIVLFFSCFLSNTIIVQIIRSRSSIMTFTLLSTKLKSSLLPLTTKAPFWVSEAKKWDPFLKIAVASFPWLSSAVYVPGPGKSYKDFNK